MKPLIAYCFKQKLLQGEDISQNNQAPRSIVIWEEPSASQRIGVHKPQAR